MERFDQKGMMIFPNPEKKEKENSPADLVVLGRCYCPNGHDLVSSMAVFDGFNGIMLKVRNTGREGMVALHPVYGLKHRISLGISLVKGELLEVTCPHCDTTLPVYSACSCGGNLVTLFLDEKPDFTNSILVCNRVDCPNAQIKLHNEMVHYDGMGHVMFR